MVYRRAFTVIELLVVILVIGILAAVSFVSFTSISQRATEASIQSDLANASKQLQLVQASNGSYPQLLSYINSGKGLASGNSGNGFIYQYDNSNQKFCLIGSKGTSIFNVTQDGTVSKGACAINSTVTSGLVLYLDAANPASYAGEPTVNLESNPYNPAAAGYTYAAASGLGNWTANYALDRRGQMAASRYYSANPYRVNQKQWTGLVPNSQYTLSAYIKSNGSTAQIYFGNSAFTPTSDWTRISATATSSASGTLDIGFGTWTQAGADILVTEIQFENKPYATPFVNGTRGYNDTTNGGWLDLSGYSNNATAYDLTFSSAESSSLNFTAASASSVVNDPSNGSLDFGTGDFSLRTIFKLTSAAPSWVSLVSKGTSGSIGYGMHIWNNILVASVQNTTNQHSNFITLTTGNWYDCTFVFKRDTNISLYCNGSSNGTANYDSGNTNSLSNDKQIHIGHYNYGWKFPGLIGLVQIYNRALTIDELSKNFNASRTQYGL